MGTVGGLFRVTQSEKSRFFALEIQKRGKIVESRKNELKKIINDEPLLLPLVDQIISLENRLKDLESLPFYKVNPKNPEQQKMLPAFRMYKELLQQYTNCIKVLAKSTGLDDKDEESPLRKWVNSRMGGD